MSDIDYSDEDEQRSLNSQGSVSSVDSSTFVTHKNLLPIPPKLNIPNKPKKINKLTMADTVDHPKTKACAAKGKGQKCSSKKWEAALDKANVTINNLKEEVVYMNDVSRDNHQTMNQYIGELESHAGRQLKQGQIIVRENHTLVDKLAKKERALSDTKDALKKEKERTKDLERKLKKSENDKKKAEQKLDKSVDEVRRLKNDLKNATVSTKSTMSNEEKLHLERERLRMKHEMKMQADFHAQDMKERDEERKNKLKYQKWGKMTGGGTGSWNDQITVKGPGYDRSRSGSYDSHRRGRKHSSSRRQESRHRSRSSSRGRSRHRNSRRRHRSRSRSYSRSRSRSEEYESHHTKYPRSSKNDGRRGLSYQQPPVHPAYHGQYQQAPPPMVQQWDWGAGNTQESKWVPNPAYQNGTTLTPIASSYPYGENEHPNSPAKPPKPQGTTINSSTLPAQQLFQPTAGDTMMHVLAQAALGGETGGL